MVRAGMPGFHGPRNGPLGSCPNRKAASAVGSTLPLPSKPRQSHRLVADHASPRLENGGISPQFLTRRSIPPSPSQVGRPTPWPGAALLGLQAPEPHRCSIPLPPLRFLPLRWVWRCDPSFLCRVWAEGSRFHAVSSRLRRWFWWFHRRWCWAGGKGRRRLRRRRWKW